MHVPSCQTIDCPKKNPPANPTKDSIDGMPQSDSLEELLTASHGSPLDLVAEKYRIAVVVGFVCLVLGIVLGAWMNRDTMEYYAVKDGIAHYRLNETTGRIEFTWKNPKRP